MKLKLQKLFLMLVATSATGLIGCGANDPTKVELQEKIQAKLPQYWKVQSVDLKSKQYIPSQLEPQEKIAFNAVIQLQEDIYEKSSTSALLGLSSFMGNQSITLKTESKGKTTEIRGVAISKLVGKKWNVSTVDLVNPSQAVGGGNI